MRARNLIVGITLAAAVFAPQAMPVLGGTGPRHVTVEVLIAPDDAITYELHIGQKTWRVDDEGGAFYLTETPVTVQLWRVRDCELLAKYRANPGTFTQIWVDLDSGEVTVLHPDIVDIPVGIIDNETTPRCSLPQTSTISEAPGSNRDWTSLMLVALMLGTMLMFLGRGLKRLR
jgi:hypothetical protein